jgi:hypothetical protein
MTGCGQRHVLNTKKNLEKSFLVRVKERAKQSTQTGQGARNVLSQERRGTRIGIKLQALRHGHVNVDSTPVAHLVRVQASCLGPFTNTTNDGKEGLVAFGRSTDKGRNEIGDARSIEGLFRCRVDSIQDGIIINVQVRRNGIRVETGKEKINVDTLPIKRENRHSGSFDGDKVGHIWMATDTFCQRLRISCLIFFGNIRRAKKVLAVHDTRRHQDLRNKERERDESVKCCLRQGRQDFAKTI